MSDNTISDNKPHLNNDLIKSALVGSKDYHYLMTAIVHESLMLKAGYIPDKIDEPLPERNPEHWQTKKQQMNVGNLWIFFATEYGHFLPSEAKRIWRYGQVLLIRTKVLQALRDIDCPPDILTFADKGLLHINDYIRIPTAGVRAGKLIYSAFNFSFFREQTIGDIDSTTDGIKYRLSWLIDDIISDAGNFVAGREGKYLQESLKEFYAFIRGVRGGYLV